MGYSPIFLNRAPTKKELNFNAFYPKQASTRGKLSLKLRKPGWATTHYKSLKDVRGWQFLTMKAAESLCVVCLPPEKHIA